MIKHLFIISVLTIFLSNCSTLNQEPSPPPLYKNKQERIKALSLLSTWNIQGKIAFLQKKKRESANINWLYNTKTKTQSLNLTTYLGINVLQLRTFDGLHTLEVNGETYQTQDIDTLITQLTHYNFPTQALSYWLKGLTYNDSDIIDYNTQSFLPEKLSSYLNNANWQVHYQKYGNFSGQVLPTQIVIRQASLTIKISIHHWTFS